MNRKYLLSSIVIAALMIVTSFSVLASMGSPVEQPQKASISTYTTHATIFINGNAGFTNASGVVWGNGTVTNPYIIGGWDINNGGGLGIYIYGATVYFIIRDCYLHGSNAGDGICLSYSSNAKVINNTCLNTYSGMWLEVVTGSDVYNNTLLNNKEGIGIYGVCSVTIHNNNFSNNINAGINVWSSSGSSNTIWNNTFYHNHGAGDIYDPAHIQAIDNEAGNKWNSPKGYGNYWSDWKTPDANINGIVDISYNISGSAGAKDNFPRAHATCTITSPTASPSCLINWCYIKLMGVAYDDVMLSNVTWTNSLGGSGIAYGTTSWQSRGNVQLFAGVNVITVTAHAYDGHTATDTLSITYDNVLPACTITSPTSNPTYATNSATINLAGSASDTSGIATVVWKNAATSASGTAIGKTSWSITGIALNAGMNLIYVNATDNAGNKKSDAISVTSDMGGLAVTITSPTSASTYSTNWGWIKLMGTASDDIGVTSVTWTNTPIGGGDPSSGTAYGTTSWQSRGNVQLFAQVSTIVVTAHDAAGNTATDVLTVTYDIVAPICTITSPTSMQSYSDSKATIDLGGTASDANGIATVTWKNTATGASGTANGTTSWSITGIALNVGINLIYVNATDNAGTRGPDKIWVTYDPGSLNVTITDPTSSPTMTTGWHMICLKGTASDDNKVTSVTWSNSLGGSGAMYMTPQYGAKSVTWQSRGNVHLLPGDNVITVTAYDNTGNSKTDVLTVTYTGL
jgi:parallel beta-helix repeat protein